MGVPRMKSELVKEIILAKQITKMHPDKIKHIYAREFMKSFKTDKSDIRDNVCGPQYLLFL